MVLADEIYTSRFWGLLLSELLVYKLTRRKRDMQIFFASESTNLAYPIIVRRQSNKFMVLLS